MISYTFPLLEDQKRDIIIRGATGLCVNVFGLEVDDYQPTKGEIHIFGDDHGEWLAFETEGWNGENLDLITQAVVWYARYLEYLEMNIQTEAPRPAPRLRKI